MDWSNDMKYTDQYGETYDLVFKCGTYYNRRPAVVAWCDGGPYATVTVNIDAPLSECDGYHTYVDTNNVAHLVDWMCEQGLMTKTGLMGESGWCVYPEVELNHEWFDGLHALY